MRLIDADELINGRVSNDPVVIAAKCAPTIDAAPVKYGKWDLIITKRSSFDEWGADAVCSECEFEKLNIWRGFFPDHPASFSRDITRRYASEVKLPKYCEQCGARMDGDPHA